MSKYRFTIEYAEQREFTRKSALIYADSYLKAYDKLREALDRHDQLDVFIVKDVTELIDNSESE